MKRQTNIYIREVKHVLAEMDQTIKLCEKQIAECEKLYGVKGLTDADTAFIKSIQEERDRCKDTKDYFNKKLRKCIKI